jgi:hypothetical protein
MTDKEFCKIDTEFYGEAVDNIKQIKLRSFDGEELKEYVEHCIKLNLLTAPVDTEEKELPEFLMKDSEGKIITCFIGGADVTEHWNNYLSKTKTT